MGIGVISLYSIGMFSKISRLTTKTLRHYDEIGLLKPEHVDNETGYRYYTTSQLPKIHQIITLKQIGLALNDIKEVLENPSAIKLYLKIKEEETINKIKEEEMKLMQIRSFSKMIQGDMECSYNPVLKEIPEVIVASIRMIVNSYGDSFYIGTNIIEKELERLEVKYRVPQYCFTIYHDGEYKEKDIDIEICEGVAELKEDNEFVTFKVIERVPLALCVLHKGSYNNLRNAYSFAFKWIEENGYKVIGNLRESYIDGVWNKDNEEEWLTEIQIQIE